MVRLFCLLDKVDSLYPGRENLLREKFKLFMETTEATDLIVVVKEAFREVLEGKMRDYFLWNL